ncbi:hypothetical protein GGI25_006056 [Coemansia spiralis]|uniref:Uncharacterized protein n=2 Tax=Coemansia TaxID=4863 RepID=A0A9W8G3D4_9FUNG|nr:hypothetical protein BX070DRAFT_225934 [Coemansia spiralis]KAJ1987547.1 hypothetical protein EDC05_005783 [Coemansia umbellata]KAJ2619349.1 hypothetical protein GGI26_005895 [Coemansia sp. RSA 1358]KAJ2669716.1 hypothetical protein GGI25_006056 [Coemansia spiralis]
MLYTARLIARMPATNGMAQARHIHHQTAISAPGLFGRFFGGKDKKVAELADQQAEETTNEGTADGFDNYDNPLEEKREPLRPKFHPNLKYTIDQLEDKVKKVLKKSKVDLDDTNWKATGLVQKEIKLKVLSGIMKDIKLPVTNRALNNIQTVDDLINELIQKPVAKDLGHPVAKFYAEKAEELPVNMKFEPFKKGTRKLHAHQ